MNINISKKILQNADTLNKTYSKFMEWLDAGISASLGHRDFRTEVSFADGEMISIRVMGGIESPDNDTVWLFERSVQESLKDFLGRIDEVFPAKSKPVPGSKRVRKSGKLVRRQDVPPHYETALAISEKEIQDGNGTLIHKLVVQACMNKDTIPVNVLEKVEVGDLHISWLYSTQRSVTFMNRLLKSVVGANVNLFHGKSGYKTHPHGKLPVELFLESISPKQVTWCMNHGYIDDVNNYGADKIAILSGYQNLSQIEG